jgi:group I intron endonuclease
MHYLYKITNIINNKVYIGQTNNLNRRWQAHKNAAMKNKPEQVIHHSIIKYGVNNFTFEHIATCRTWSDANELETILVSQYNSHIESGKGYNSTRGGFNAPKTEEWKRQLKDWHASLSEEEKLERKHKLSEATKQQIQEKGHPAQGTKRTPEQLERLSEAIKNREDYFTTELRKRMSDSHKGQKHPPEVVEKRKISLKATNDAKITAKLESGQFKCNAPDCDKNGIDEWYVLYEGIRYCATHGTRLKRNGTLEKKSVFKYTKANPMPEEVRKKCGLANIGRKAHNRHEFAEEQIRIIMTDPRGAKRVAKDFGVSEKVIVRVRRENKVQSG